MPTKRILIIAILSLIAYVLFSKIPPPTDGAVTNDTGNQEQRAQPTPEKAIAIGLEQRPAPSHKDITPPDALHNERLVSFPNSESLESFLTSIEGSNLQLLGRSNYSHTLRLGFSDYSDLARHLPPEATTLYNYPVAPPEIEEGQLSNNAVAFKGRVKEWVGITSDNSNWGAGVSVAVLDTGILPHPAFGDDVQVFSVAENPSIPQNPHGTTMASLWRSADGNIPSIAPAVDLMSIQVADGTGTADLFSLSEAIYLAVEQGAQLIPISMGTTSSNAVLDAAIQHARESGALIIASAGNSGDDTPFYPAAHPDTLSIAAIDYNRNYPGFSNTGETLSFTAPGVGLLAADSDGGYALSTGTSPAAQIAGNVVAATMSELDISDPYQAWEIISENLNELGAVGQDNLFGIGYPQLDVILNYNQAGRYDAAIASTLFVTDSRTGEGEMQIVVSNPGTENLSNSTLAFDLNGSSYTNPLPEITAGESISVTIPLPLPASDTPTVITSQIILPAGTTDIRPRDNVVSARF